MKEQEVFKDIKGYEGRYQISNHGRVKSLQRKGRLTDKILKFGFNNGGYHIISLCKNGHTKTKTIHKLVLVAFSSNLKNKPCCNHLDGIKTNNHIDNLEWVTDRENHIHASLNG